MRNIIIAAVILFVYFVSSPTETNAENGRRGTRARPPVSKEQVIRIMKRWAQKHKKGYRYALTNNAHGFEIHCPLMVLCNERGPYRMFIYNDSRNYISIGFAAPLANGISLSSLNKYFNYIALDRVHLGMKPTPGWRIRGVTPMSSTRKGVTFLAHGNGRVKFRVKWRFFRIHARNTHHFECRHPKMDVPMKKKCYANVDANIPVDITIDLPIQDRKVLDCRKSDAKRPCGGPRIYND